jgi:hypothetical protein
MSWQESFPGWGCPTPGYPGGPMFSVRVVSHSWLVPILKRQDLDFPLAWLSHINVAQEPWRRHACNGLYTNKWHYSRFFSIHLSARCISSRPRTDTSTPEYKLWMFSLYSFLVLHFTSFLLGLNILFNTLFSNTLNPFSSLNVTDQVLKPIRNSRQACELSSSHAGEYEDDSLLGYSAV